MKLFATSLGLALALGLGTAAAQDTGTQSDCAFLEQSFQEVYDGMREHSKGGKPPEPEVVTMFVAIQNNIILLHQARGCDAGKLVALAHKEKQRYGD